MSKGKHVAVSNSKSKWNKILLVIVIIAALAVLVLAAFHLLNSPDGDTPEDEEQKNTQDISEVPQSELPVSELESMNEFVLQEQEAASYERWLAATMVMAISMQYSDFEIQDIYLTGENELNDKMNSDGVYIKLIIEGETKYLRSVPLEGERGEPGTTDLYSKNIGFSTYDFCGAEDFDSGVCKTVEIAELENLISQALLVSLYEN